MIMTSRIWDRLNRFVRKLSSPRTDGPPAHPPRELRVWSIGIYFGDSPFHFVEPDNLVNPVLTSNQISDVPAVFVADPFMIRANDQWSMFFEVYNQQAGKGEVGLATSDDGIKWTYQGIVLAERFHLSYPYVFQWKEEYYMVPESYRANSVRLYRATNFPVEWMFVKDLLAGQGHVDSSPFYFNDKWWLFAGHGSPPNVADCLSLYYADELAGDWREHPKSPTIEGNAHIARPAGRVLVFEDRVIRYAQDCDPGYGLQVRAFEITELTTTRYEEREVDNSPILTASGTGWNRSGMHHIDPHRLPDGRWMACVDGQFVVQI